MSFQHGYKQYCAVALSIVLTLAQQSSFASTNDQPWNITKTAGMMFFNPDDVLDGTIRFNELPEVANINRNGSSDMNYQIGKLADFLKYNGIPLGLGVNSNRDSFFDLYAPYVDILLDEPAARFGKTPESEVGKMHFLTHDSLHLYAGSPGLKITDLKNRAETKKRLTADLMKLEAIGSVWTAMNHVRWYWHWREANGMTDAEKEQFQKYNKGLSSMGEFNHQDMMDILDAYMSGKIGKMMKLYVKNIDLDTYLQAKEAGVPMLFPDFKEKLGASGERLVVKYGLPILMPLFHMYDKKFGYVNLIKYASMQADFYMSDWYVEWTDHFQVGQSLDVLEGNIQQKMMDFKNQKFFSDVPEVHHGVFDVMYMRNAVAQFGRKLIELRYLENERIKQGRPQLSPNDLTELARLEALALQVNNEALKMRAENREISADEILQYREKATDLFQEAEAKLPVDHILPLRDRLAHADYSNFWSDSFSVIIARPESLTKFLSARGIWKEALKQRMEKRELEAKGKTYVAPDLESKPILVGDLEVQLAAEYNQNKRGNRVEDVTDQAHFYTNRLETFRKALNAQVLRVFIPQLKEFSNLSPELKDRLANSAENFARTMDARLRQFRDDYQRRFIEYDRNEEVKARLVVGEGNIKWAAERSLYAMMDILETLETGKNENAINKAIELKLNVIEQNAKDIRDDKEINPSLNDTIKKVTPMKRGFVKMLCSAISRMCINQDLSKIIRSVPKEPFMRDPSKETKYIFKDASGKTMPGFQALPEDAAVIIAMNHDHASLDGPYLQEVGRMLGIKNNLILTTKTAWPHIQAWQKVGVDKQDPNIVFKQNPGLKKTIMNYFSKGQGSRTGFSIFPEGELPFWGIQFPLFSNFGAFNIARTAANLLKGKRPVYFIQVHGNFLRSLTAKDNIPIEIEITQPELVPTSDIGLRDEWVERKRNEFEQKANDPSRRGQMVDMIHREKVPGGRIYTANEVHEYKSAGEFFREKADSNKNNLPRYSCQRIFLAQ